jgi:hypothetical protein
MRSATAMAPLFVAQTAAKNWPPFLPCAIKANIQIPRLPKLYDLTASRFRMNVKFEEKSGFLVGEKMIFLSAALVEAGERARPPP